MRLSDFAYDQHGQVLLPPQKTEQANRGFAYADGAEEYLLKVLRRAEDLSTDSDELEGKAHDWPSRYHLGQGRANIFRALSVTSDQRVLELGSGCGAISRYLGERCARVDCVEGSYVRARTGRERCRGLDNTRVFCADINDLAFEPDYDVVTLIGVWEYAPVYANLPAYEACVRLLKLAGSALKDDGVLVIAIENKIGLKYWTGWPEDHTGRIYDSIHGYPRGRTQRKSAITFSQREIEDHLRQAGLPCFHFYYCFPDYKFASTVFSSVGNDDDLYLHNWIDVPFGDPGSKKADTIHEALALRTLSQAGLLREFANSFLIVASKRNTSALLTPDWIAKKISGFPRLRQHRCVTTLANGRELRTMKEMLSEESTDPNTVRTGHVGLLRHRTTNEAWQPGDLLVFDVYEALFSRDFEKTVIEILRQYYEELQRRFGTGEKDEDAYPLMRGECFDFVLRNIVRGDGKLAFIDTEWSAKTGLPADYMLYRCIRYDVARIASTSARKLARGRRRFAIDVIKTFFPQYNKNRYRRNRELDKGLTDAVAE